MIVTHPGVPFEISTTRLTDPSNDYAQREKRHHSSVLELTPSQ